MQEDLLPLSLGRTEPARMPWGATRSGDFQHCSLTKAQRAWLKFLAMCNDGREVLRECALMGTYLLQEALQSFC